MSVNVENLESRVLFSTAVQAGAHLVWEQQLESVTAGQRVAALKVKLVDALGSVLNVSGIPVKVKTSGLSSTQAIVLHDGVAKLPQGAPIRAATYLITATTHGITSPATCTFIVIPAPAILMRLVHFIRDPRVNGGAMYTEVRLLDRFGNLATNDSSSIVKLAEMGGSPAVGFWDTDYYGTVIQSVSWIDGYDNPSVQVIGGIAQFNILGDGTGHLMKIRLGDTDRKVHPVWTPSFRLFIF